MLDWLFPKRRPTALDAVDLLLKLPANERLMVLDWLVRRFLRDEP